MQSSKGTFEAETARDYTINLPESEHIPQLREPSTWVLPSQQQKSLLLFLKGQPQVLGVAEILIGLVMLCLGVTTSPFPRDYEGGHSMTTKTGYHLWGSLSFFISGVVSIAAGRKIQGSLGMNALSATVAGIGTSMIITEEISMYESAMWRSPYETVFTGLLTGMLLLSLGGGCTALALAVSACRAACSVSKVVVFLPNDDGSLSEVSSEHVYDEVTFQ
ncbi:membrane-spanning 4-domains subfamily A member 4A-like isoform X3 [Canis lupus familiaris]|uniref:membrane-spanning 4-domains subfamily A member 4A-like isoform X3 n=1 Tax=Canis lupus familiaris TaxID=9615 RepID=UPI0006B3C2F1|nr:membrane-spanning 4-domains subfamily A member 4A-like isoform X3 [Canis lupus familiaris]|eukprot:XP_005633875.2 membrane-spanning 4-domains subfamily A member 4A-like isoform X1 [Canis lupus familiaris]